MHFWEFQTPEKNPVFPSRFRYIPEKNPVSGVGTRFRCHTDTDNETGFFSGSYVCSQNANITLT